jgi:hypothetical protein
MSLEMRRIIRREKKWLNMRSIRNKKMEGENG